MHSGAEQARELLLTGGIVRTMDGRPDEAHEAVLLRDGRVVAVGDRADVASAASPGHRVVDVDGAAVMPGFVDTHPHLLHWSTFEEAVLPLFDAESHADIERRIRARAEELPPGQWIVCSPVGEPHYFQRRSWRDLAEGVLPDRWALDRAAPDHPVWIQAWAPTTPNVTVFNSAGLAEIGIGRAAGPEPHPLHVERDERGEPTGRLMGAVNNYYNNEPFWDSILMRLPGPTEAHAYAGAKRGLREWHRMGVTTIYEAHIMDFWMIDVYRRLRAEGELSMRVLAAPDAEPLNVPWSPPLSRDQLDERLERALAAVDRTDDRLHVEGVTIADGGPPDMGLMVMRRPYRGPLGQWTNGVHFFGPEKIEHALRFCAERGLRCNVLVAGDREHDEFLRHLRGVAAEHPDLPERRWILQHGYVMGEEHCLGYARLGFDATTSCSFTWGEGPVIRDRMGADVLADLIPLRRMLDAGLRVAGGTDWGPRSVFEHLELAQTHRVGTDGRRNDGPAQVVDRYEALRMWTADAGRVLRWPGVGTLAPGSLADVAVLDRDVATCELDRLADTEVLATLVGGEVLHDTGLLAG